MYNNIILIGFMGSGKTSVGSRLANKLDYNFTDTDVNIVEQEKKEISEIFAEHGEEYFRKLETETIQTMIGKISNHIISTGGGLPLRECNAEILKQLGFVVFLKTDQDTILKRVKGDTKRPLLAGDNVEEKVEKMLAERNPKYLNASHITVDTNDKSFTSIVNEIIEQFEQHNK